MIAEQYPWPPVDGYRQRLSHVIAGLARAGEVEVMTLDRRPELGAPGDGATDSDVDLPEGVVSVTAVAPGADAGVRSWLATWARGDMPRRVLGPDWSVLVDLVHARLAAASEPPVDLVWFSHVDTWWPLREIPTSAATIVDFDNLENLAMRLRRFTPPDFSSAPSPGAVARVLGRWGTSRAFDLVDGRRWDKVQRACAGDVDRVVVCSELDRERSGVDNVVVVGNGADAPAAVELDRTELRGGAPTMLFVGALDYEPNTDAVRWFANDVLPLILARRPDARFVVVGRGGDLLAGIADDPGVELVGAVAELQPYLDAADISVVPIRVGAGTRLKVVEALANHLPMVTTTVGCEGIDVVDGQQTLIADDARSFADRCLQLIGDPALRQRLADSGGTLFEQRYDWATIEADLAALAESVVSRGRG